MKLLLSGSPGSIKDLLFSFKYENMIRDVAIYFPGQAEDEFFGAYEKLGSEAEAQDFFRNQSPLFLVAETNSGNRKVQTEKFRDLGGFPLSFFSSESLISRHNSISGESVVIQMSCDISNDVVIEKGVFIGMKCLVGHDVKIGAYTTLGPKVTVLGYVSIGENCEIAAGVTIMPSVKIGNNVKISVGQVIKKDLADNATV